jgi:hypothetical protein
LTSKSRHVSPRGGFFRHSSRIARTGKAGRQKAVSVSQITQSFFVFLRHNSSHDNKAIFSEI